MKLAVVGATGLVGREIITVLTEQSILPDLFIPVASERSYGQPVSFNGSEHRITGHQEAIDLQPEIAIFSAGAATSKTWAPMYTEAGITVIDNSSAWRMDADVPLVVPEINSHLLNDSVRLIANPNCSTIQLVMVMAPLHKRYGIRRVVVSTYQSVTGTGSRAVRQLENERMGVQGPMAYPHPIDLNLFPHGGDFLPSGETSEEVKLVRETRKILGDEMIRLTGTVVRVPVFGGHSESVNIEFEHPYMVEEVVRILGSTPGILIQDDPSQNLYPMPIHARGRDEVLVGRIRRDESQPNSLNMFIVADNLRKGAATNAVQIAQLLIRQRKY